MIPKLLALALAVAGATPALADYPPYAGSHDDASYGDAQRVPFAVDLPVADGRTVVGSSHDDTTYAPPAREPQAPRTETRVAQAGDCDCCG